MLGRQLWVKDEHVTLLRAGVLVRERFLTRLIFIEVDVWNMLFWALWIVLTSLGLSIISVVNPDIDSVEKLLMLLQLDRIIELLRATEVDVLRDLFTDDVQINIIECPLQVDLVLLGGLTGRLRELKRHMIR